MGCCQFSDHGVSAASLVNGGGSFALVPRQARRGGSAGTLQIGNRPNRGIVESSLIHR
jgi:hypothetical protein